MIIGRDSILAAADLKTETVTVPEWGGDVIVSCLSAYDRDAFEASMIGNGEKPDLTNLRARLVARCIVDESGDRTFSDEDITALGKKSASAINKLFVVAQRINGMEAGAVDAAAKK